MDNKYGGMTINEQLYAAGLFDNFYATVEKKDVDRATEILNEVELTEGNIVPILKSVGLIE